MTQTQLSRYDQGTATTLSFYIPGDEDEEERGTLAPVAVRWVTQR